MIMLHFALIFTLNAREQASSYSHIFKLVFKVALNFWSFWRTCAKPVEGSKRAMITKQANLPTKNNAKPTNYSFSSTLACSITE